MRFRRQLGNRIFTSACAHSVYFSEDTERYEYSTAAAALAGGRIALHTASNVRLSRTLGPMSFSYHPRNELLDGAKRLQASLSILETDSLGRHTVRNPLLLW